MHEVWRFAGFGGPVTIDVSEMLYVNCVLHCILFVTGDNWKDGVYIMYYHA